MAISGARFGPHNGHYKMQWESGKRRQAVIFLRHLASRFGRKTPAQKRVLPFPRAGATIAEIATEAHFFYAYELTNCLMVI